MALSTSRKYSILAFADDKQTPGGIIPCLNVYGTDNSVSNGRNVTVWDDELAISQLWKLLSSGTGKYRIMTLATPSIPTNKFVLDYSIATGKVGNCDMWEMNDGNTDADTIVEIGAVQGKPDVYTIKLSAPKSGIYKYLTAEDRANGKNVSWQNVSGAINKQWKFVDRGPAPSDPVPPTGSKTLNLTYKNINQRYSGNIGGVKFNPLGENDPMYKWGCSRCSVACVLSNIAGYEVNPLNIPHNDGFVNFVNITSANIISTPIQYKTSGIISEADCLQKIKSFIDANMPAIIRTKNGSVNHFCVAYGYTNGAATKDDILTYDTIYPKDGNGSELTSKYGESKNLTRVLSLNSMTSFSEVFTYHK